jgi:uncharacterized protein YpiB (UPF0302 family)
MYDPHAPQSAEELALIEVARRLADRLREAEVDSAEEKMLLRQVDGLRREGELGGLLAEEIGISGQVWG